MTTIETKIGVIGWDNENDITPIVCIDKAMRTALEITDEKLESGCWVKVTIGQGTTQKTTIARVGKQFKELVGSKTATLNDKCATLIDGASNDLITISTDVTENELQETHTRLNSEIGLRVADLIRTSIEQRARNQNPVDSDGNPME